MWKMQEKINKTRRVCYNDPAWESSGWVGGMKWVGWVTNQLPISGSPLAGSTYMAYTVDCAICIHIRNISSGIYWSRSSFI